MLSFSQARDNEIWVQVLEKAWAKVNGNYENTIAGFTREALKALTGAPTEHFLHDYTKEEDLWKRICSADKSRYVITCGVGTEDHKGSEEQTEQGLVSTHAYSLIAAHEVETEDGIVRLLKIRNPWGGFEWTGDWSDKSDKWTPELKEALEWTNEDDGKFFISMSDYYACFNNTTICKKHDGYVFEALRLS